MMGSAMVCVAESKEEVLEVLKKDPYTTGGVWNMEKVCGSLLCSWVRKGDANRPV